MINNNNPAVLAAFTGLLKLPDIRVIEIKEAANGRSIKLLVQSRKDVVACRVCNKPTNGHGEGRKISLRHLPLLGQETYIEIIPRRGICRDC